MPNTRVAAERFEAGVQGGEIDQALRTDGQRLRRLEAVACQHAGVLGRAGQKPRRTRQAGPDQGPGERGVGRLGAAAGEDDPFRGGADEPGDATARLFQRGAGGAALGMDGGRVARQRQRPRDRRRDLRPDRRCGVVVEIEARLAHRHPPRVVAAPGPAAHRSFSRNGKGLQSPPAVMLRPPHDGCGTRTPASGSVAAAAVSSLELL